MAGEQGDTGRRRGRALGDLLDALRSATDGPSALRALVPALTEVGGYDAGLAWCRDESGQWRRAAPGWGDPALVAAFEEALTASSGLPGTPPASLDALARLPEPALLRPAGPEDGAESWLRGLGLRLRLTGILVLPVAAAPDPGVAIFARRGTAPTSFLDDETLATVLAGQLQHAVERQQALARATLVEQLLDTAPAAIFAKDLDGRMIFTNRAAAHVLGHRPDEVLGHTVGDYVPDEIASRLSAVDAEVVRAGRLAVSEETMPAPDGMRTFLAMKVPLRAPDGSIRGLGAVATDITDRIRAENALRDSEDRFRSVFVASPVPHLLLDVSTRTVTVNAAFGDLVGYEAAELDGHLSALAKTVRVEGAGSLEDDFEQFIASGAGTEQMERRLRHESGRPIPVRLLVTSVQGDEERPRLLSVLVQDLTRQQELEEQLAQSQKMEAIGRLAGGIAHDFNNLLTVIGGYTELIDATLGPGHEISDEVAEIQSAADRASALVEQLLAYARRQVLEPTVVDLGDLVADLKGLLRRLLDERIELVVTAPDEPVLVLADQVRVQQVLVNLAVNARDAMPEGGRLDIVIEPPSTELGTGHPPELSPGPYARVRVRDTGTGMDPLTVSRCFEPFFTTKGKDEGSGLGLSMAYGIAVQSGGALGVRSAPGVGSEFTLWLPEPHEQEAEERPTRTPNGITHGSGTVLVAEDEVSVRAFLRITLERAGYTVVAAPDGEHALSLAESSGPFDLLVTDVVMPRLGGLALARRLLDREPGLRVLLVSGYPGDVALLDDMPEGVKLLAKPFGPDELTRAVRELFATGKGE